MDRKLLAFLPLVFFWKFGETEASDDLRCDQETSKKQGFSLFIQSKRGESENWVTSFVANGELENKTDWMTLDLKHNIVDCGDKKIFQIRGTFRDTLMGYKMDTISFNPKCGINAGITNDGRTIQKLNAEDRLNGVAFTNRPLKINELFEVKIQKINTGKFGYFMGIGVTANSPSDIEFPNHINHIKPETWALYHNQVYMNGHLIIKNREQNLDKLQVGDRVGILRSKTGTLHLFINGMDQGPAASNIPPRVFGVFELYGDSSQVTITESPYPDFL